MTIQEVLKISIEKLKENKIEDAILKAKIIVSNVIEQRKEYLIINGNKTIEDKQVEIINKNINKLIEGAPLQYITNTQEFMGLEFYVNENVLIPQPDTEILVDEVINISKEIKNIKILDLCTGSGAIAVSLSKNLKTAKITATDISKKALSVAKINCKKNNIENVKLIETDLFNNVDSKFNIIVSNPPYIETEIIAKLSKEVQNEPHIALDGGKDGLNFYKKIIDEAYKFLENDGFLCLEIGYNQKEKVTGLIIESNKYKNIYSKKDLAGNDRIIICQRK